MKSPEPQPATRKSVSEDLLPPKFTDEERDACRWLLDCQISGWFVDFKTKQVVTELDRFPSLVVFAVRHGYTAKHLQPEPQPQPESEAVMEAIHARDTVPAHSAYAAKRLIDANARIAELEQQVAELREKADNAKVQWLQMDKAWRDEQHANDDAKRCIEGMRRQYEEQLTSLRAELESANLELQDRKCSRCDVDGYWFKATKIAEQRAAAGEASLRQIADEKQKWISGVGSYVGGETNAAFATRLQRMAAAALAQAEGRE